MSSGSISLDDLRALVDVDPQEALDVARQRLAIAAADAAADAAHLWWIAGRAERPLGATTNARASLEEAVRLARGSDDPSLHARVTISLALDVGSGGDLAGALALLDSVALDADVADRSRLANQRGVLLYRHGRLDAA